MSDVGAGKIKIALGPTAPAPDRAPKVAGGFGLNSDKINSSGRAALTEKRLPSIPSPIQLTSQQLTIQYEAVFQVCTDDVPTLQPQRCLRCVRLYEPAFPCRFLA